MVEEKNNTERSRGNLASRLTNNAKSIGSSYANSWRVTFSGAGTRIGKRLLHATVPVVTVAVLGYGAAFGITGDYRLGLGPEALGESERVEILNIATNGSFEDQYALFEEKVNEATAQYTSDGDRSLVESRIQEAYDILREASDEFADSNNYIESNGFEVHYVPGNSNAKITFPGEDSAIEGPSKSLCLDLYDVVQEEGIDALGPGDRAIYSSNSCQTEINEELDEEEN